MDDTRTFASLSPTLLARKGAARPAMRPQLQPMQQFHENTARQMDDLGWDDHGEDDESEGDQPRHEAEVVPIGIADPGLAARISSSVPEIVRQQTAIPERLATDRQASPRRSALAEGRRAAFTLRLDAERHLKLRLACAVANRSAQQLVTEALDRLINETPDIAELAARVGKRT